MDGICPGIRRKRGSRDGAGTVWTGRLRSRLAGLKACTWLAALQTGRQIRTQVCESGLERNLSSLVDFYCECGRMGEARQDTVAKARQRALSTSSTSSKTEASVQMPSLSRLSSPLAAMPAWLTRERSTSSSSTTGGW
ncbi:uncharacterized protein LOC112342061 isoform X2 [Selaginella moellendorffii]|uniref:uncharacterized protein LOC112342061 isoform X2 n=1 Tax=Selaginella moellendorffii TaxID=88036 RepID=UPI000D1C6633|nr:uncharacterized protein LOC112342061 isoform X2 [Selaginella moellendorffii]|eukprot:XP_024519037.1 uncharacterized protein LOC112342061 isoform X2 [Selaginella moellendorffii]